MNLLRGIKYLLDDVIAFRCSSQLEIDISINKAKGQIMLTSLSGETYLEDIFDFENPVINESQRSKFEEILSIADYSTESQIKIINSIKNSELPLLKLLHFIINEYWINEKIPLDKHKRHTSKSIKTEWLFANVQPVAEFIIKALLLKLNIKQISLEKNIHFTCDYDILELWRGMGIAKLITQIMSPLKRGKFLLFVKRLKHFINEYFGANPLLNSKMFVSEINAGIGVSIKNIAFWHIHVNHKEYDFRNHFDHLKVLDFVKNLSHLNVENALHPCYGSSESIDLMNHQARLFKNIFGKEATKARFHYLQCSLPSHLNTYLTTQIIEDYSYCFPDKLLFRGGRSGPIKMWDKSHSRPCNILSYPLTIMESTLSDYMKLTEQDALKLALKHIKASIDSSGYCDLLWHNRSMFKDDHEGNYHPELFAKILMGLQEMRLIKFN
jgi:hypothetical protein